MSQNSNIYVIMSAIFLSIIIMGGVAFYVPKTPTTLTYTTYPDLKTTGSSTLLGSDPNLISGADPNLIVPRDETIYTLDNSNPRTMSLSGTGKITVQASQALIVLGVFTEDKTADWAVQENAQKMAGVVSALKALGIPDSDIQTIGYNINPVYNWELRTTVGYQVTNTLQITLNDLTKIGAVIDKSSDAGANTISSVTFTIKDSNLSAYKLQAYTLAVADVKAKATAITEGFGIEVAGIQSINESFYYPVYRNTYTAMDMKAAGAEIASTPIISGNLEVSVTLNVVYLLA
jgi:uncharacterized protein YggE